MNNADEPTADQARGVSPETFEKVWEVFAAACDMPLADRRAYIESACGKDSPVARQVLELIEAHERVEASDEPAEDALGTRILRVSGGPEVPAQIGPYRVQREIGHGGMGVVYLARQGNPEREVALKIVRRGMGSTGARTRFEREIRVLGRLEHPGITRIYEAGTATTPDGPVAYFAMEFVRGPRLSDEEVRALDARTRIELVARIADAVQHAHGKGVIHRDLKPANILVSESSDQSMVAGGRESGTTRAAGPQPKILDFGVARLLEPDTVHTAVTEAGLVIGTIGYMSPEQLAGDIHAVDARSDIYALGVMLYELLTGRMPFDLRGKPIAEAARIVRDVEPAPIGVVPGLDRSLQADIQTIIRHATEKDRERRYPTAAALSEDLRRALRDEPILARPPSATYQLSKFARRNKGLVAGIAAASVALVAGAIVSTVLLVRAVEARRQADAKERLATAVRGYMIDHLLLAAHPDRMGYEVKMLDVLTTASEGLHERFAESPDVEGSIRADLGRVLNQIGKIEQSKAEYLAAIPLLETSRGPDHLDTIMALNSLCTALQDLAENDEWLRWSRITLERALRSLGPENVYTLHAMVNLSGALITLNQTEEAREVLRTGLAIAEKDPDRYPAPYTQMLNWLAACEDISGNFGAALDIRKRLLDVVVSRHGPDHREAILLRANLALGLVKADRVQEAAAIVVGLSQAMEAHYPPGHPSRAQTAATEGFVLGKAGRFAESETLLLRAYEMHVELAPEFDWATEQRIHSLRGLYTLWPGHEKEFVHWGLHSVKGRLMLAHAQELSNLPGVIDTVIARGAQAGVQLGRTQVLDLVWDARDELAPDGHKRRAAFYGNYARACVVENHPARYAESLAIAESSLAYATEREVAEGILAAARGMAR